MKNTVRIPSVRTRRASERSVILISVFVCILIGVPTAVHAQGELTVDQVIARHVQAIGGRDAIRSIRSLVHSQGEYEEADYRSDGTAWMARMRPYYRVIGNPEEPGFPNGFMEGYDGSAWEWYGNPGIVLRTVGAASEASRHGATIESAISPLVGYPKNGSSVILGDSAVIDGRPAYRLTVTARDGTGGDVFVDKSTFLIVSQRGAAPIHAFGDPVSRENRPSDFRRVAGVLMAHKEVEVEIATGEILSKMSWGKIEANLEMPSAWFSPPEFSRTRVQQLIEHVFMQRSDIEAVLWTYHDFRTAYPEIDTRAAMEVAGFQILKMGDVSEAIGLLTANAEDYPNSASSAFGLARALATAKRFDEARAELNRSLSLDPGYKRSITLLDEIDGK